jgi:predicted CXXCH cytochrome family protein
MAAPSRTQKQIAERYKGNLGYYNRLHPWRRARSIATLIAIVGGLAGIVLYQLRGRETFFSAGEISAEHAGFGDNCASCHDNTMATGGGVTPGRFKQIVSERFHGGASVNPIDRKCERCHQLHSFHEPTVVQNRSCTACHEEHLGPGPMNAVAGSLCASCHDDSAKMADAAHKGMQMDLTHLDRHPHPAQRVVFQVPRPKRGYTQVFSSFWDQHPEFQINVEKTAQPAKIRDPDMLRFNHQRHFASDIPLVNGQKLDCNYCHKPDADARYMQRVSFAANCQACHSLQIDPKNPDLTLPHGNASAVRAFLRTLPTQYAELAVKKGITRTGEIQDFVAKQMTQLRERVRSGEEFERQVFFTSDPYKPQRGNAPRLGASFYGCAFCHEVKPVANATPLITKPVLVDRWMSQARFDHSKHRTDPATQKPLDCNICHHAEQSRDTSDILMPAKANCVTCHSPQGKVVAECITCHTYHAPPEVAARFAGSEQSSLKQMLLGVR